MHQHYKIKKTEEINGSIMLGKSEERVRSKLYCCKC